MAQRYRLWEVFSYPTSHGPILSVAVSDTASTKLISFYSLMLQSVIIQIWMIVLVLVMSRAMGRNRQITHNMGVANVAIWNSRSKPLSIIFAMIDYSKHLPLYALMWACLALLAFAGQTLFSTFVSPFLILGYAAPVNATTVFVPSIISNSSNAFELMGNALVIPSSLRAINSIDGLDQSNGDALDVSAADNKAVTFNFSPIKQGDDHQPHQEFSYSYNVTGVDFGLQKGTKLLYQVEGACFTTYKWNTAFSVDSLGTRTDTYTIPISDNPSQNSAIQNVSAKTGPPVVYARQTSDGGVNPASSNTTFAFVVSSIQRYSYTPSSDPWYESEAVGLDNDPSAHPYQVRSSRPALSCWQQDSWIYDGVSKQAIYIGNFTELSPAIVATFQTFLAVPRVVNLATSLGYLALRSATGTSTGTGLYFDAGSSKLELDMRRLITGAYVATKNILGESTLVDRSMFPDFPNAVVDVTTNTTLPGAGDFVIWGSNGDGFVAMSLSRLVAIPVCLCFIFATVSLITTNRFGKWPWADLNALNATILYASIDHEHYRPDSGTWKRNSATPYHEETNKKALVRPVYHRRDRSYGWNSISESEKEGFDLDTSYTPEEPVGYRSVSLDADFRTAGSWLVQSNSEEVGSDGR